MSKIMTSVLLLLIAAPTAGCDIQRRLELLEADVSQIKSSSDENTRQLGALRLAVMGVSSAKVTVAGGRGDQIIFGNLSGANAAVSLLNQNTKPGNELGVQVRRIQKPSDAPPSATGASSSGRLPVDYDHTEWLELSAPGSRRQVVVPCGYEVIARSAPSNSVISAIVKYDKIKCSGA